ncbi:PQQ-binding-like beta-propeller repeat protein [Ktedonosporobacter rubrisoli]|nr:PQQ-binding-like beta-propeller repeat protein [Ktedonosporobacter rubrisoli]
MTSKYGEGRSIRKYLLYIVGSVCLLAGIVFMPLGLTAQAAATNWPTFMGSNAHTGYNASETVLTASVARQVKVHWKDHAGGSISSQPVIVNGAIYWGSWDGYEHATDLNGHQRWQTFLGKTTPPASQGCTPASAGVSGTATVADISIKGHMTPVVLVSGGNSHFYALDATNGKVLWDTKLASSADYMLWAGSTLYKGSVYVGVASYGDCPLVAGRVVQMNASTGAVEHSFTTVAAGCIGGGIWMAPTIDEKTDTLYVSTGTLAPCKTLEKLSYALIALHTSDLSLSSSWQIPNSQDAKDSDFGSTPTLFSATVNGKARQMIGLVNKNGVYYAFDRTNIAAGPLWEAKVSTSPNNIASSAWDGKRLYVGGTQTTIKGKPCLGSVRAVNPATGAFLWEYCAPSKVIDALTVVPGLVFTGAGSHVVVLDAATGRELYVYRDTSHASTFWGGVTVSNGVMYMGNEAGNLYAFGL